MNVDNHGFVMQPKKYQMWSAELTGNTDDTGGIYVFLLRRRERLHRLNQLSISLSRDTTEKRTPYSKARLVLLFIVQEHFQPLFLKLYLNLLLPILRQHLFFVHQQSYQ